MTCSAESCLSCQQGRECAENYGWPTSRKFGRRLSDVFPDVRAGQLFVPVEDPPLFTPEESEGWSYVALWLLAAAFVTCITGACIAFANV